ncbi:peptidoglycan-binding protein [Ciceribacter azotifigens]|uniref:peptidoglycan-binding protein n=1 Tax=Ciceribacter azotifigens TaxID=2069303 RepID=UPI003A835026
MAPKSVSRAADVSRPQAGIHELPRPEAYAVTPVARVSRWRHALRLIAALAIGLGGLTASRVAAQEALQPGEAVVTRFSGTVEEAGRRIIDVNGASASILDLRQPGGPPIGAHWFNESQRAAVTAGDIGQVFGVTVDDATPPNIYLTATAAFGLHRNADNSGWMAGMWGAGGGPGTVWKLDAANGYRPQVFAEITLNGRANSGAALGNIAFDPQNRQLYVSDLETGMIHRLRLTDGADLGTFDHGIAGRTGFLEVATGEFRSLPEVSFDPATSAHVSDCSSGDFSRTPSCWNLADFRRRIWGLGVRVEPEGGAVRLYYAVWGSQGFGNPDYAAAEDDDRRNAIWSVGIAADGSFDGGSVRREFFLPDFFRSPEAIARAGRSHPVSDIAFPASGDQNVMLVAERGGMRNLGLAADNAFAYPHEARVLRYELTDAGSWRGAGRYDVGYYDRSEDGPPYIRANSAGGVSFGPGYGPNWQTDLAQSDGFVWMSGDGLCSPRGLCLDGSVGEHTDSSQVTGIEGRSSQPYEAFEPVTAFQPYPSPGPASPPEGPDASFMVDADVNTDTAGNVIAADLQRNDATKVGDVAVFQPLPGAGEAVSEGAVPPAATTEEEVTTAWPEGLPPEGWLPAPPPEDGWFPPPPWPIETDLAIRKTGPAECQEGVECTYTVTIRNLGAIGYVGPLAITDTMPAGATLASTSPGWNCVPGGDSFSCVTNAFAVLAPGATAAIEVNLLLPADIPGPTVENCAAIDWFEMGTDDGPGDGNDEDCVDTPVTDGFDLGITKEGPANCTENADCSFLVEVVNHGPGAFNGVIAVRDPLPAGATFVAAGFDPESVTCAPSGTDILCQTPDMTLPVGGVVHIFVRMKLPDGIAGGAIENCAEINWGAMAANDGPADVHPDLACVTVHVLDSAGFFDLSVAKQGPAHCDAGGNCTYQMTVSNSGPDDYTGQVVVEDTPEAGVTLVVANPEWACVAGPTITCTLNGGPHTLHPGDSRNLTLTVAIPDPAPADPMFNCVTFDWAAPGMPPNDNPADGAPEKSDGTCVPTLVGEGFDLEIAKTGPAECYEGGACDFTVSVTNNGPAPFAGLMTFIDEMPAGSTLEGVTGGVFTCNSAAPGSVICVTGGAPLPPGAVQETTLHVRLPDPVVGDVVENCAAMNWAAPPPDWYIGSTYTGDDNAANDGPACATVPVLAADLAPWGATSCELGTSCPIDVRIENRGGKLFKGAAGLRGTLDPGVTISSIESRTPGLTCRVTGTGRYECDSREMLLKPGATANIHMTLDIPADFPERLIVHRKEMLWPDSRVKDRKPENDRHTSTIMILQQQEPTPPPPTTQTLPPPANVAAADLAVTKSAGRDICVAGSPCDFLVTVTNASRTTYVGPLRVSDVFTPGSARLIGFEPSPWTCRESRGAFLCSYPRTTLRPGESRTLALALEPVRVGSGPQRNCARLDWNETALVSAVQQALNQLGFAAGEADGKAGSRTRKAIADYRKSAGLPASDAIDTALVRRLFASWGEGDANAANDNACATVTIREPVVPPPVCKAGQTPVDPARAEALRAQGWRITSVSRGGRTILCGVAPAPLTCPSGYTAYRDKNRIPPNSEVVRRERGGQVLFCARPQPVSCPSGYEAFQNQNRIPKGWEVVARRSGGQVLYCARPPQLVCPTGYKAYPSRSRIPAGFEVVVRRSGEQVLYCARPQATTENCPRGWKQIDPDRAASLSRQGWQIRRVGSLTCGRPGDIVVPPTTKPPSCTGGRTWSARQQACVCPRNTRWDARRERCVPLLRQVEPVPGQTTPKPRETIPPLLRILPPVQ